MAGSHLLIVTYDLILLGSYEYPGYGNRKIKYFFLGGSVLNAVNCSHHVRRVPVGLPYEVTLSKSYGVSRTLYNLKAYLTN